MTKAEDFNRIAQELGKQITLISATKNVVNGYISTTETSQQITAIVQPLKAVELAFLPSAGYTTEDLKSYISIDYAVNIGDVVEHEGKRYKIHHIEKNDAFQKLLLKKEP